MLARPDLRRGLANHIGSRVRDVGEMFGAPSCLLLLGPFLISRAINLTIRQDQTVLTAILLIYLQ